MSIDVTKIRQGANYEGIQRVKLPVCDSSGTTPANGNLTVNMIFTMRELFLSNDSNADMTLTVNCVSGTLGWVLHAGETFDERLPEFNSITVTSTGNWRWYVRGNIT